MTRRRRPATLREMQGAPDPAKDLVGFAELVAPALGTFGKPAHERVEMPARFVSPISGELLDGSGFFVVDDPIPATGCRNAASARSTPRKRMLPIQ